jgi:WD40 repeat protein
MPVDFDWEFEEDADSKRGPTGGTRLPVKVRRWLPRGAVVLLLFLAVGLGVRSWVKGRLDAVTEVEMELQGVVELELRTIAERDTEVFRSIQNPDDARWVARQMTRYLDEPDTFAPAPGFTPAGRAPEIEQVSVLGRTGTAELTVWYDSSIEGRGDPLPFEVTWFYRQSDDGVWHHVPPPDDYLGIPHSWHSESLVIRATEAEADLLNVAAHELVDLVIKGCEWLDCPEDAHFTLSFHGELVPLVQDDMWILPALDLAGIPEDDRSQATWQRALKLWVVEALVASQVGGRYLDDRLIYRELMTRFQKELGLLDASSATFPLPDQELLARALRNGDTHPFRRLWEARHDPGDPDGQRLLEAEVALLLQWLEDQMGAEPVIQLLPLLGGFDGTASARLALFGVARRDVEAEWFSYLFEQAGITPVAASTAREENGALEPPRIARAASVPPGDQIAYICGGQIWAGNADGERTLSLTRRRDEYRDLHWSPDGRWLMTMWVPDRTNRGVEQAAVYLVAADGSSGRLLTDDPTLIAQPIDWSPDGREAIYRVWPTTDGATRRPGVWATNVETWRVRSLPGGPIWSPDGAHVVLFEQASAGTGGAVWLADANWQSIRQIADRAWTGPGEIWSPDSTKFAFAQDSSGADNPAIAIYDMETEALTPLITADELTAIERSLAKGLVASGRDPVIQPDHQIRDLWPAGWSADGSQLRVWAQATARDHDSAGATVLAAVPLDDAPLRVLTRGTEIAGGDVSWSPLDPSRMVSVSSSQKRQVGIFDVDLGPVYTATQSWDADWSPDGAWAAFAGEDGVTIVDQQGRTRSKLGGDGACIDVAWNPSADLSALSRQVTINLVSAMDGWRFENVRISHDPLARRVRVWGEVFNETDDDQRIIAFVPIVRDQNGRIVNAEQWHFLQGEAEIVTTLDLAHDASLPFGLSFGLPLDAPVRDDAEIIIFVASGPGEPTRDDLEIPVNEYDVSLLPEAFRVTGTYENPGPDLDAYVTVLVTVFGLDGRLMGWGWQQETDQGYLSIGSHPFDVRVDFAPTIADMALDVGYYKIQVFGR